MVPGGSSPVTSQLTASGDFPDHRAGRGKWESGSLSLGWGRELEAPGGHEGGLFSGRNKGEHKALTVRSLPSKTGQCDVHPA